MPWVAPTVLLGAKGGPASCLAKHDGHPTIYAFYEDVVLCSVVMLTGAAMFGLS